MNRLQTLLAALFSLLLLGSIISMVLRRRQPDAAKTLELRQRIRSWWIIVLLLTAATFTGVWGTVIFFALVSALALREYFALIPMRRIDERVLIWAYLAIPIQYACIAADWYTLFVIVVPVYFFLALPCRAVILGETHGFLNAMGTLHWGLMMAVFGVGHLAYLGTLGPSPVAPFDLGGGGPGWLWFLIALTELNDVAQFLWGKALGKRRVIPRVSPNKTVGGLVGGVATTTLLATVLGPWLTPLTPGLAAAVGAGLGLAGFIGDVTFSAVKRDLGVKDSGTLLPGHGGIWDRIDSLSYTAPLFFHFVRYFYY